MHGGLFLATVLSVFFTQLFADARAYTLWGEALPQGLLHASAAVLGDRGVLGNAGAYTATLLGILGVHEAGHWFAARAHRIPTSLPYFLPLPGLSFLGTAGAVIRMKGQIGTRRALLDVGAAGPLAGLVVALPLYAWGAHHSLPVPRPTTPEEGMLLGESLLLKAMDVMFAPTVPEGMELMLSPVAYAAWGGLLVTMLNLLPVGQLDGGHVAYSLFGARQNAIGRTIHRLLLASFVVGVGLGLYEDLRTGLGVVRLGMHIHGALFWLAWFFLLGLLGALARTSPEADDELTAQTRAIVLLAVVVSAAVLDPLRPWQWAGWLIGLGIALGMEWRFGALRPGSRHFDHPDAGGAPLGPVRVAIAVLTLLLFVLLFMPQPIAV